MGTCSCWCWMWAANVGNHSLPLALLPRTSGVIAFEPNPQAFAVLQFNVAINGLEERIQTHRISPLGSGGGGHAAAAEQQPGRLQPGGGDAVAGGCGG